MLAHITGDGMCISAFLINGFLEEIIARVNLNTAPKLFSDNSDATSLESADELSEAVVPSLPAEECPPVKLHRLELRRVQRGRIRKENSHWLMYLVVHVPTANKITKEWS
ncbi:hypothetical protein BDR06DRAFT_796614 [Suillus hirtellus]|nr:hypothetical protein BDR06DRAFT_796614 [Suillus hirtellus]